MPDEVTSHLRPQLLGRMTQRAVVEALRVKGPMSRADISRLTGISPTTVSSAVTQVLKAGLVEESDAAITGPGRPGKILRLAAAAAQVIGVSVEPEWCEIVGGGLDALPHPDRHVRFPTPNTYARLLAEIERHARPWIDTPDVRTLGLGLSLPGMIDPTGDRAVFSPNLHQTDDQRPGHDLADRLGLETIVLQESDALCLAESRAHRTADLAILDFVGGLGIGVLTGGRLLHRHMGLPRELGHVTAVLDGEPCGCGNRGCLETVATDAAFARAVSAKVGRPLTPDEACTLVRSGKVAAVAEIDRVLDYLSVAVAAVANLFAPPLIIVHGRLLDLAPDLVDRLAERSRPRKLRPLREHCRLARSVTTKAQGAVAGILAHVFESLGPMIPA
jgi:N-acetylglucosamine repressor